MSCARLACSGSTPSPDAIEIAPGAGAQPRPRPSPSGAPPVMLTRLHVRYTPQTFPEDLVFQETDDRTNFQARYVLRHPWAGDVDACPEAKLYFEGVRQRQEQRGAEPGCLDRVEPRTDPHTHGVAAGRRAGVVGAVVAVNHDCSRLKARARAGAATPASIRSCSSPRCWPPARWCATSACAPSRWRSPSAPGSRPRRCSCGC